MTTVTDIVSRAGASAVFMCDFSPPRNPTANWPDEALSLNSDLICVPHLAPHPTRPDAITAAHAMRERTGAEVVFNFATRDSRKSEVWERLGNARSLGLENMVVLQGDADRGVGSVARENRFKPTELIRELQGLDKVSALVRWRTSPRVWSKRPFFLVEKSMRGQTSYSCSRPSI